MEARNRLLPDWFHRIRSRQISLPRFQRMIAWGPNEVAGLLTTVLRGLPGGATLILEVGDTLPFVSRTMVDAPTDGERVTELLLDGQQRLTALWRSLNDTYAERTYFVEFEDDPYQPGQKQPSVFGISRWVKDGRRYPIYADDPKSLWQRGYIPVGLLKPGDIQPKIDEWVAKVVGDDHKLAISVHRVILELRQKIAQFNLPFLSLPTGTPREVALDVFIKMNTSSVALSTFDILVAQVESIVGESLHDLVAKLLQKSPQVAEYETPEKLILDVAALMQDRVPNLSGYAGLNLEKVVSDWPQMVDNIDQMVRFLEAETVFDKHRLPTDAVLAVTAALWQFVPKQPDALGNAKVLLRKYLWRAFFTGRYDRAAATAAINDFRALRDVLLGKGLASDVPIFNAKMYPMPTIEELTIAGWPKNRNTLARAIVAATLRAGARDIADDAHVTRLHLKQREYHHLFPAALLGDAEVPENQVFRALNCALITWRTNRTISAKEPLVYLRERAEANSLGSADLQRRLRTHLIPLGFANLGGYAQLDSDNRIQKIQYDYANFLTSRASLILRYAEQLCDGREPELPAPMTDE